MPIPIKILKLIPVSLAIIDGHGDDDLELQFMYKATGPTITTSN